MNGRRIRVIAFDFGGTLFSTSGLDKVTPELERAFVDALVREGGVATAVAGKVWQSYLSGWKARRAKGSSLPEKEISSLDIFRQALASKGLSLPSEAQTRVLEAYHSLQSELFAPLPGVIEWLPLIAKQGYRLAIASNNAWVGLIRAPLRRHGLEELFDEVIVSGDIGWRKPHRRMFEVLLERMRVAPGEVLYVGDSFPHDCATPRAMGMMTCLVDFDGRNKNSQKENATEADLYLTRMADLIPALGALAGI